jgi:hypothetical protein
MFLSVPLPPGPGPVTLIDCLRVFCSRERLDSSNKWCVRGRAGEAEGRIGPLFRVLGSLICSRFRVLGLLSNQSNQRAVVQV